MNKETKVIIEDVSDIHELLSEEALEKFNKRIIEYLKNETFIFMHRWDKETGEYTTEFKDYFYKIHEKLLNDFEEHEIDDVYYTATNIQNLLNFNSDEYYEEGNKYWGNFVFIEYDSIYIVDSPIDMLKDDILCDEYQYELIDIANEYLG